MGLVLSASGNISCKTQSNANGRGVLWGQVSFGEYDVDIEDFCEAVKYVLTNTDLSEYDTRKDLVNWIHSLDEIKGYNDGNVRYGVPF